MYDYIIGKITDIKFNSIVLEMSLSVIELE